MRKLSGNDFAFPNLSRSKQKEYDLFKMFYRLYAIRKHLRISLTGNSSLPLQMPVTCLCCMTCLMFNNAGNAVHPALILQLNRIMLASVT